MLNYQFFFDPLKDAGRTLETLGLDADGLLRDNQLNLSILLSNRDTSIWPLCPGLQTLAEAQCMNLEMIVRAIGLERFVWVASVIVDDNQPDVCGYLEDL